MTGQNCAPADFDLSEWVSVVQEKYSPISFLTQTKTEFPRHPPLPQTDWSAPDWLCAGKNVRNLVTIPVGLPIAE